MFCKLSSSMAIKFYYMLVCSVLAINSFSAARIDPQFQACAPKNCGKGPNITFPFYMLDQHLSYCGSQGFGVACNEFSEPVILLSPDNYTILEIFYHNASLRVRNSGFGKNGTSNFDCDPIKTSTIGLIDTHFTRSSRLKYNNLTAQYSCSDRAWKSYTSSELVCTSNNGSLDKVIMMPPTFNNSGLAWEECDNGGNVPVDIYEDANGLWNLNKTKEAILGGVLLEWNAVNCTECSNSGGRCGILENTVIFRCFCPDGPQNSICVPEPKKRSMTSEIVGIAVGVGLFFTFIGFCIGRKQSELRKKRVERDKNIEAFFRDYGSLAPKRYTYSNIRKITNSFKDSLGEGGYGGVYKGMLKDDRPVAVKLLNKSKCDGEEFINEVGTISRTSHVNIVTLLGFCFEGSKRALVYEFMPNGSLEKFTYGSESSRLNSHLRWDTLYRICLGIARGLEYLHCGCNMRILHFDIKPHNILLDEEFCPKISDFGLAKICPGKESMVSMLAARGTIGYIAPEVFCRNIGGVSHKSDVYSYGMMVLEMSGGRKLSGIEDQSSETFFSQWIFNCLQVNKEIDFDGVTNDEERKIARKLALVGLWCIQTLPSSRPSISQVIAMLEADIESLPIPPIPFVSTTLEADIESLPIPPIPFVSTTLEADIESLPIPPISFANTTLEADIESLPIPPISFANTMLKADIESLPIPPISFANTTLEADIESLPISPISFVNTTLEADIESLPIPPIPFVNLDPEELGSNLPITISS